MKGDILQTIRKPRNRRKRLPHRLALHDLSPVRGCDEGGVICIFATGWPRRWRVISISPNNPSAISYLAEYSSRVAEDCKEHGAREVVHRDSFLRCNIRQVLPRALQPIAYDLLLYFDQAQSAVRYLS